jgi:hypothetical protein
MLVLDLTYAGMTVANVQALREHCFCVETGPQDDYHYFAASSDEERREWKHAIKHRKVKPRFSPDASVNASDDWVQRASSPSSASSNYPLRPHLPVSLAQVNESWIWTPDRPEPIPFGWEDVGSSPIKMINLLPIIQNVSSAPLSPPYVPFRGTLPTTES